MSYLVTGGINYMDEGAGSVGRWIDIAVNASQRRFTAGYSSGRPADGHRPIKQDTPRHIISLSDGTSLPTPRHSLCLSLCGKLVHHSRCLVDRSRHLNACCVVSQPRKSVLSCSDNSWIWLEHFFYFIVAIRGVSISVKSKILKTVSCRLFI